MHAIQLLSAVLAIQSQALALGAPVQQQVGRTQVALYGYLSRPLRALRATPLPEPPPPPEPPAPPEEAPATSWDPDPHELSLEASRCRALLLEVIRRAAHDWVLYRNTRRPERAFAADAYVWLFEEEPGHPNWERRQAEGEPLLAFLTVCELLDLDPEMVRRRVRNMTPKDILTAGRPAEHRRNGQHDGVEDYVSPEQLDLVSLDDPVFDSHYEAHFAVPAVY